MGNKINESIGWYGTVAIVLAYLLVSFKILDSAGIIYQLMNLTGALGIMFISIKKKASSVVALNVVWAIIAAVAIIKIFF